MEEAKKLKKLKTVTELLRFIALCEYEKSICSIELSDDSTNSFMDDLIELAKNTDNSFP